MDQEYSWDPCAKPPKKDKTLGYMYFLDKSHPLANSQGKVYVHRHVASITIGRWVLPSESVHHKNELKDDNRPENLEVMDHRQHVAAHNMERYGPRESSTCERCGRQTFNARFCSYECSAMASRIAKRPEKEELEKLLETHSWVALGEMFGVSDNAVRKWAKAHGLATSGRPYRSRFLNE